MEKVIWTPHKIIIELSDILWSIGDDSGDRVDEGVVAYTDPDYGLPKLNPTNIFPQGDEITQTDKSDLDNEFNLLKNSFSENNLLNYHPCNSTVFDINDGFYFWNPYRDRLGE